MLEYGQYKIEIYHAKDKKSPVVFMILDDEKCQVLYEEYRALGGDDFTLVTIEGVDWNKDLSPWEAPAVFKKGEAFTGGADDFLSVLKEKIVPEVIEILEVKSNKMIFAGYSLAGLFGIYSAYQSELFTDIVSASGSLWFPGFMEYTNTHKILPGVKSIYFSVGDKEANTKNAVMQTVEDNTRELSEKLSHEKIQTIFELNAGGHFKDAEKRLARGIYWVINKEEKNGFNERK